MQKNEIGQKNKIGDKVRTFIGKFVKTSKYDDNTNLFATGLINSLFAMQLVMFVEKEFKIKVENQDLNIDNFNSINAVTYLIERKLS